MSRQFASASQQYCENTAWTYASVPITLCCWVRVSSGIRRVITVSNSAGSNLIASLLTGYPSTGYVSGQLLVSGYSYIPNSLQTFSTDTWEHIGMSVESGKIRVSLRGVVTESSIPGLPTSSGNDRVSIGRLSNDTSQLFSGQISDAAIFDDVLTDGEWRDLAIGRVTAAEVRPKNLRGLWFPPYVDNGMSDRDWSGYGFNLAPSGAGSPVAYPTWGDDPPQLRNSRRKVFRVGSAGGGGSTLTSWWAWNQFGTPLDHGARN